MPSSSKGRTVSAHCDAASRGRPPHRTRASTVLGFLLTAIVHAPTSAFAHATERGVILLLPTDLYIGGGAAVVALTFVLMAAVPAAGLNVLERARRSLGSAPAWNPLMPSAATLVIVLVLIATGYLGNRDPLSNPLPLMLWTIWWVALTFLHAIFGNLWAFLHPWRALHYLLTAVTPLDRWRRSPPVVVSRSRGILAGDRPLPGVRLVRTGLSRTPGSGTAGARRDRLFPDHGYGRAVVRPRDLAALWGDLLDLLPHRLVAVPLRLGRGRETSGCLHHHSRHASAGRGRPPAKRHGFHPAGPLLGLVRRFLANFSLARLCWRKPAGVPRAGPPSSASIRWGWWRSSAPSCPCTASP